MKRLKDYLQIHLVPVSCGVVIGWMVSGYVELYQPTWFDALFYGAVAVIALVAMLWWIMQIRYE